MVGIVYMFLSSRDYHTIAKLIHTTTWNIVYAVIQKKHMNEWMGEWISSAIVMGFFLFILNARI